MKNFFFSLLSSLTVYMAQAQENYEKNPLWLIDHFKSNGTTYVSSEMQQIGKSTTLFGGYIQHVYKTLTCTIPSGATIKKIYPFIFNIDGLKGPGGDPDKIPWGSTPDIDYRWGTFHAPTTKQLPNGQTLVSVEYDNWSDIETRAGFLIVEYTGGTRGGVSSNGSSNVCNNTVKFTNTPGTSRTVYLYLASVNPNSTVDFCSVAKFIGAFRPGESYSINFKSDKVLLYQSYDIQSCSSGNNLVVTGSLSDQCCGNVCQISINDQ